MRFKKSNKQIIPLAYPFYYVPVLIIALIGFFDSVYLSVSHYRNYADMGYKSFCAVSRAINCDTVSQSPYSIFLGVPVPIWGVLAYCFFLFLLGFAWSKQSNRKRPWTLIFFISLAFSIYSVILAFISSYYIHSYCIMCILSYGVNLALLFYAWVIRKRFACESFFPALKLDVIYLLNFKRIAIPVVAFFGASVLTMILYFPPYWHMNPPVLSENIPTGINKDGYPWIGAKHPELVITEFTDYLCFQCKKMHYFLRQLVDEHPDKIRLVHRQFPMDDFINPLVKEPFHKGAAKLAILAIYAAQKGDFWEMNDYLFQISHEKKALNLKEVAHKTGLKFDDMRNIFNDQLLYNILWDDIKDGVKKYQFTGTPGYVINGKTYQGQIPADILKSYLK